LAILASVAAALVIGQRMYAGDGPATADGDDRVVYIERGSGVVAIASRLHAEGAIESPLAFRIAVRLTGREAALKAGEYAIPSRASLRTVITILESGRTLLHPIVIPEGLTSRMIVERLAAEPVLSGAAPTIPPEGVLLPDTYMVSRGDTREAVLARMRAAHDELLQTLWPRRAQNLPVTTIEEAVILASIVEKETALAGERPLVAGVFVNRLRRGMRMESDPTIIYGLTGGEALGRGLRQSELDRPNAWNTYQIDGLPPTAICNPGRAALEAVLNPPETDALFFVADGTGGHAFAASYPEHLRNVARWRRIEAQANQTRP
jgi:UPF0755 protein